MPEPLAPLALPAHPLLAAWSSALNDAGYWATVYDAAWRFVFITDEVRLSFGGAGVDPTVMLGAHIYSAEVHRFLRESIGGRWASSEGRQAMFLEGGPCALEDAGGDRDELRRVVDPELAELIDQLHAEPLPAVRMEGGGFRTAGADLAGVSVTIRIDDAEGHRVGMCTLQKPAAGMSLLAAASAMADLAHLERMRAVERPDRRPTAILMADLEASSPLARRLSTAQFFMFGRRFVRRTDRCIINEGGIVGRHAGDGVVGFFLADTAGSESAAARACITAARAMRDTLPEVAERSELSGSECSLRFGLHWGATVYMGRILTDGRSEVTALGDEVNEAARIEACATGARMLGSKSLIERLNDADAEALGIDTGHTRYTSLADLTTATDKARRDAPAIPVCDLQA